MSNTKLSTDGFMKLTTIIIYLILLSFCGFMFIKTIDYEPRLPMTQDYSVYLKVTDQDSVLSSKARTELDSLIHLLGKSEKQQYVEGINDVRQETNNIINKINGWLSFWLAILALVGGILPFILSWKREEDYKEKFLDSQKGLEEHIGSFLAKKSEIIEDIKTQKEEIQKRLEEREKEIQRLQEKMEMREINFNITNIVNSFIAAKDNKLLEESRDRDLLRTSLLKELSQEFDKIITMMFPDNYTPSNKTVLKTILIQFHSLYIRLRIIMIKRNRTKEIEKTILLLKQGIDTVVNDTKPVHEIEKEMKELKNEISNSYSLFYSNL